MLKEVCHNLVLICIFQFVRCVVNDLEPFLNYFCQNAHLQNKGHDDALMMLFVRPDLLASTNSGHKLLKLDLKSESNLWSTLSVKVGFGARFGARIEEIENCIEYQNISVPK